MDTVIALAGNPNVGKSTVFNSLTGLNQHTGNWPGKTVENARGRYGFEGRSYILVDIPGTYSLMANSPEETIARDFICFGGSGAVIVVADATCLERNLNLVLQILEITGNAVLCVNLLDEAEKKKIRIDLPALSALLGIPVIGACARKGLGLAELKSAVSNIALSEAPRKPRKMEYGTAVEKAVSILEPAVKSALSGRAESRWVTLKLLDGEESILSSLNRYLSLDILKNEAIAAKLSEAKEI
ncbi:MAG: FeoB small GTPase domain-containing protein, partial [Bacillota bacterium]|nr:FeoB small GTPase domain-containing protein [Bacillota bacterium]